MNEWKVNFLKKSKYDKETPRIDHRQIFVISCFSIILPSERDTNVADYFTLVVFLLSFVCFVCFSWCFFLKVAWVCLWYVIDGGVSWSYAYAFWRK